MIQSAHKLPAQMSANDILLCVPSNYNDAVYGPGSTAKNAPETELCRSGVNLLVGLYFNERRTLSLCHLNYQCLGLPVGVQTPQRFTNSGRLTDLDTDKLRGGYNTSAEVAGRLCA